MYCKQIARQNAVESRALLLLRAEMAQQKSNKVRIIAGKYRRRMLAFPDVAGLRPTPDRVRETVFNWLADYLYGASCLDLFAGSGAMGFEAASREAARVVMVEKDRQAFAALKAAKQLLGAQEVELLAADAVQWLRNVTECFDVIFLDPPYAQNLQQPLMAQLRSRLKPGGLLYVEADQALDLQGWDIHRQGRAGAVSFMLLAVAGGAE